MKSILFLVLSLLFAVRAGATPARILIIRHAEKPDGGHDPDLSDVGFQRAQALVQLFNVHPEYAQPGLPVAIFALAYDQNDSSNRSIETVTPLANQMGLPVLSPTLDSDLLGSMLLKSPNLNGKVVLVAWKHSIIPDLAQALGAPCPHKWKPDSFDRVWIVDFKSSGVTCINAPESLMPGDSQAVIDDPNWGDPASEKNP